MRAIATRPNARSCRSLRKWPLCERLIALVQQKNKQQSRTVYIYDLCLRTEINLNSVIYSVKSRVWLMLINMSCTNARVWNEMTAVFAPHLLYIHFLWLHFFPWILKNTNAMLTIKLSRYHSGGSLYTCSTWTSFCHSKHNLNRLNDKGTQPLMCHELGECTLYIVQWNPHEIFAYFPSYIFNELIKKRGRFHSRRKKQTQTLNKYRASSILSLHVDIRLCHLDTCSCFLRFGIILFLRYAIACISFWGCKFNLL